MNIEGHSNHHSIESVSFELGYYDKETAFQIQTELFDLFHAQLHQLAADVLDQVTQEMGSMKFEKLYLDLGALDPDDWKEELVHRFPSALMEALNQQIHQEQYTNGEKEPTQQTANTGLELLMYYLVNGSLPWWANANDVDLRSLLAELLEAQGTQLVAALKKQQNQLYAAQRFAALLSPDYFVRAVNLLQPSEASFIIEFVETVVLMNGHRRFGTKQKREFSDSVKRMVVIDLLMHHGTAFNRKMFVIRQIGSMAAAFSKSYTEMLGLLAEGLSDVNLPFSLRATLPALIGSLHEEAFAEVPQTPPLAPADQLRAYIEGGDSANMRLAQIQAIFSQIPDASIAVLREHRPEDYVKSKFLDRYGIAVGAVFAQLLTPGNADFLQEYTEQLFFVQQQEPQFPLAMSTYEKLVWEVLLIDMIKEHGSAFNRRMFIERTLLKAAERQGIDMPSWSKGFLKALKKLKLPAHFDQSVVGIISSVLSRFVVVPAPRQNEMTPIQWLTQVFSGKVRHDARRFDYCWHEAAKDAPKELVEKIAVQGSTDKGRKRLLDLMEEHHLVDWLELAASEDASAILSYKQTLDRTQREQNWANANEEEFSKAQWWVILNYLLNQRGTRFNQKVFLKQLLTEVALRFGWTYSALIGQIIQWVNDHQVTGVDGKAGFTTLIHELQTENAKSEGLRVRTVAETRALDGDLSVQLLWTFLEEGSLPWDILTHYPSLRLSTLVKEQLRRPEAFWTSFFKERDQSKPVVFERLLQLMGQDYAIELVAHLMKYKHGSRPAKPFLDTLNAQAPAQERLKLKYFAKILSQIDRGETIDFDALAQHEGSADPTTESPHEDWPSLFLVHIHQHWSAPSSPAFAEVVAQLLQKPDVFRRLLARLSAASVKRLVSLLDKALFHQMVESLFRSQGRVLELISAYEKVASKDAMLMAQVALKQHWVTLLSQVKWNPPSKSDTRWITGWWNELMDLKKLSEDHRNKLRKKFLSQLSKPVMAIFQESLEAEIVSDQPVISKSVEDWLVGRPSAQKLANAERKEFETEWRAFLRMEPNKGYELMVRLRNNAEVHRSWVKNTSNLTLEVMFQVLAPFVAHKAISLGRTLLKLLLHSGQLKRSGKEAEEAFWLFLFDFWRKGKMDYFNEKVLFADFSAHFQPLTKRGVDLVGNWPASIGGENLPAQTREKLASLAREAKEDPDKTEDDFAEVVEEFTDTDERQIWFVHNAGLVLLWSYLKMLFVRLELMGDDGFTSPKSQEQAIMILHYLVSGEKEATEDQLILNKLLCAWPLAKPVETQINISVEQEELCGGLLQAVIGNWPSLGQTSVSGFKESFLMRDGKLGRSENGWQLVVEAKPFDVLLDSIPWGFRSVKLPWMEDLLEVVWR